MGEVFAGRYELVDPIGRGGVGAVWRAWDHRRRRYVAAKVLLQSDAHSLLRFVREQALRIDHPHVLAPTSWAADDDKVLFTMDLVAGGSLVHLVNDYGPLPPAYVCTLLDQLLSGLAAVHAEGVVHRDIKPANVLMEATGTARPRLRLSDFGIAMRLGEPRLTETNLVVGTPGYIAPEQMMGSEPDFPADLFAVGLVALYLLEGAKPDAKALVQYFTEHGTPGAPQGVPEPLWQVVSTLLQPDPAARFRTATGARKALAAAAELLPEPGPDDEQIEIFDQLGPLPPGFAENGPVRRASGVTSPDAVRPPAGGEDAGAPGTPPSRSAEAWRYAAGGAAGGTDSAGAARENTGDVPGDGVPGHLAEAAAPGRLPEPAEEGRGHAGGGSGAGPAGMSGDGSNPVGGGEVSGSGAASAGPTEGGPGLTDETGSTSRRSSTDGAADDPGRTGGPGPADGPDSAARPGDPDGPGHGGRPGDADGSSRTSSPGSTGGPAAAGGRPVPSGSGAATGHITGTSAGTGPGADHPATGSSAPAADPRQHTAPPAAARPGLTPPAGSPRHAPAPEQPPGAARSSAPEQPAGMSDTGSFHLPPPPVTGSSPATPHAPAAPGTPPPDQALHHRAHHPQAPAAPVSPNDPTQPLRSPQSHPPAYPAPAWHQPAEPFTAEYTAQVAQVPTPHAAMSQPGPTTARRRRPGPPAKVAVPLLLLALACYAVGFWALTQI